MDGSKLIALAETTSKIDVSAPVVIVGKDKNRIHPLKRVVRAAGISKTEIFDSLASLPARLWKDPDQVLMIFSEDEDQTMIPFLKQLSEEDSHAKTIIVVEKLEIEKLFTLLSAGAKAFLTVPISVTNVEEVIAYAQTAPDLDPELLDFENRDNAFSQCVINNLNLTSRAINRLNNKLCSQKETMHYMVALRHAARLASDFKESSDEALRDKIIESLIERAERTETRLRKARRRIDQERKQGAPPQTSAPSK